MNLNIFDFEINGGKYICEICYAFYLHSGSYGFKNFFMDYDFFLS